MLFDQPILKDNSACFSGTPPDGDLSTAEIRTAENDVPNGHVGEWPPQV